MTATATSDRPSSSGLQGEVLAEAGRRMLPVLTSKLLAAVADRAEQGIDQLAGRLDDVAENGLPPRERTRPEDGVAAEDAPEDAPARPAGALGSMMTLVLQQARALLDLVVRLLAQAAAAARTAAERLRANRAPEGIDDERAALDDDVEDETDQTDQTDETDDLDADAEEAEPARA